MKITQLLAVIVAACVLTTSAQATLIAEYNFDGGSLSNAASGSFSPLSVIGAAPDLSGNSYHADGNSSNYLEVAPAVGGAPVYTVSVWVWTDTPDQGEFKGIFSNNDSPMDANSWQMDSHMGQYRMVGRDSGVDVFGSALAGQWQNLILQKAPGDIGSLYLDGAQVNANIGANPGGLQEFRIGINRNSDNAFAGLIDTCRYGTRWKTQPPYSPPARASTPPRCPSPPPPPSV